MTRRFRSAWLWLAGALFTGHPVAATPPGVDGTRQVGPFAVSAHGKSSGNSSLFLRTGNPFGRLDSRVYEVRWNGRPVELPVIGKRFWQVLDLPDAKRPALLDLHTLQRVPVEPWLTEGQGETQVSMNASNSPAVALSPGRTRFVLRGEGRDAGRGGDSFGVLLLIDLATGKPEALRLDRQLTPYPSLGSIDADWIAAHLKWTRGSDGRERLGPR